MHLATDLARAFDPVLLARDCGIEPDDWQRDLLRSASKRVLMLCARQTGKTEMALLRGLWTALFQPKALVLIISPSQRQSGETFRRLLAAYGKLEGVPALTQESALRAQFSNGSRVLALPGSEKTTRGYAGAHLVIVDEAAQVADEILAAIRPTMAVVDGTLIALSTPFGARGWFHDAFVNGGEEWTRVRVPASECSRYAPGFLAGERKALGEQVYRQEFELEFLTDSEAIFPMFLIDRAFTDDVRSVHVL